MNIAQLYIISNNDNIYVINNKEKKNKEIKIITLIFHFMW